MSDTTCSSACVTEYACYGCSAATFSVSSSSSSRKSARSLPAPPQVPSSVVCVPVKGELGAEPGATVARAGVGLHVLQQWHQRAGCFAPLRRRGPEHNRLRRLGRSPRGRGGEQRHGQRGRGEE